MLGASVQLEVQLGSDPGRKSPGNLATQETGGASEPCHHPFLLGVPKVPGHGDEHPGVRKVGTGLDPGEGDQTDSRVSHLAGQCLGDDLPDQLPDLLGPAAGTAAGSACPARHPPS